MNALEQELYSRIALLELREFRHIERIEDLEKKMEALEGKGVTGRV